MFSPNNQNLHSCFKISSVIIFAPWILNQENFFEQSYWICCVKRQSMLKMTQAAMQFLKFLLIVFAFSQRYFFVFCKAKADLFSVIIFHKGHQKKNGILFKDTDYVRVLFVCIYIPLQLKELWEFCHFTLISSGCDKQSTLTFVWQLCFPHLVYILITITGLFYYSCNTINPGIRESWPVWGFCLLQRLLRHAAAFSLPALGVNNCL